MDLDPYKIIKKRSKSKIILIFAIWIIASFLLLLLIWESDWVIIPVIVVVLIWPFVYLFWALYFRKMYKKLISQAKEESFIKEEIMKERVRSSNYVLSIYMIILGLFLIAVQLLFGVIINVIFALGLLFVLMGIMVLVFRRAAYNLGIKFERNEAVRKLLISAAIYLIAFQLIISISTRLYSPLFRDYSILIIGGLIACFVLIKAIIKVVSAIKITKKGPKSS